MDFSNLKNLAGFLSAPQFSLSVSAFEAGYISSDGEFPNALILIFSNE